MRARLAVNLLALGLALVPVSGVAETLPAVVPPELPKTGHDSTLNFLVIGDQLEFRANDGVDQFRWDVQAWVGGDYDRVWIKTEGEKSTSGPSNGDAELQVLYGRLVSPFWDLQVGIRQDAVFGSGPNRDRTFAVLGVEGLAPYWFEVTPALFVSDDGDVSARVTATYDLLFTQRLIAQSRFEVNAAVQDARNFGIESGFNDVELGLRIRYELRREFAPYIGVNWLRQLGDTAELARDEGDDDELLGLVAGVRFWF